MKITTFSRRRSVLITALAAFCLLGLLSCDGLQVSTWYEHGAVATAAPLATEIGLEVLQAGGNAFDAAVAVGFALAVVHPEAGNIGGGGFAVVRHGATDDLRALDFRETAPAAATTGMYLNSDSSVIPEASTIGARASGVPGTVAGLHALWQAYGSLPWEDLVRPAAILAETGFAVDDYLAESFAEHAEELGRFDETKAIYAPAGSLLQAGDQFRNEDLGQTLYRIAADGSDGFYTGEIADSIVASMQKYDGLITAEDLAGYEPVWREPIRFRFDSLDIISAPPPSSGGIIIGQILTLLEPFDLSAYAVDAPEYIHLFTEAARCAYADRADHLGDPDFYAVPRTLLDSGYLARRRALIDPSHAATSEAIRAGSPPEIFESDQTTHYSICDADGNMVAVTYTLNTSYGSLLTVGGAGFLLNNEMDDFSVKPGVPNVFGLVGGEANKIEPGKRMLSSMSPTLVLKHGQPYLALGSPGGSKIITTVAQAIIAISRFDLSIEEAVAQPRFHHQWLPDLLYLEQGGYDINVTQDLIRLGHNVRERSPYGDLQIIMVDKSGLMAGASDPRKRGTADGY